MTIALVEMANASEWHKEKFPVLGPEDRAWVLGIWPGVAGEGERWWGWASPVMLDLDTDGRRLVTLGAELRIKRFSGAYVPDGNREVRKLIGEAGTGPVTHVQVSIPHVGLLAMDEVQVLEDACTDALQRELDDGWRILAVCPPNAARRPDYVLGRTKR